MRKKGSSGKFASSWRSGANFHFALQTSFALQTLLFNNEIKNFICEKFLRYHAAIKMFRDIGDKLGVIRGEIGLAKCLVQMKQYKDAMNYYQLAVKGSHAAGNKVRCGKKFSIKDSLNF